MPTRRAPREKPRAGVPSVRADARLRVGIVGAGAIGGTVGRLLEEGRAGHCALSGVVTSRSTPGEVDALIDQSDVIVEAAGHEALAALGSQIVAGGVDLVVVSVGALVDDSLLAAINGHAGRLLISTGAIGGLDLLKAAMLLAPLETVSLQSTKHSRVLVRPWMPPRIAEELEEGVDRVEAFRGTAREAAVRFPESANVAATLGLATVGLDETTVTVVGDPRAKAVRHLLRASGPAGRYEISIENRPSPENQQTSAITPYAVLRALRDLTAGSLVGI